MQNEFTILFIEDDQIEKMKFQRTIDSINPNFPIIYANNGEAALEMLKKKECKPSLILLDLNMPRLNGIEFLNILKNNEELKYIPTVIITTSNNFIDLKSCYELGIAGYVLKPLRFAEYVSKIEKLISYWSINELIH